MATELNRRDFSISAVAALIASSVTGGCNKLPTADTKVVNLRQEWFPYAGFAGEVLAAKRYAPKAAIRLNVRPGSETIDPIKSVITRQDDIGVASADLVIQAIATGAPIIAIGVVNDVSPTCFIARRSSGIKAPGDFRGKLVGILPGTNTEKIFRLLMNKSGLRKSDFRELSIPQELQTFILGRYDVRPAFVYDEPVTLARANIPINIIKPQDYGVNVLGTIYFARLDVLAQRRENIVKALSCLVRGWRDVASAAGRSDAIRMLKQAFPEVDAAKEKESLDLGAPLFLGPSGSNRPLEVTQSHWEQTIGGLVELGILKPGVVTTSSVWNPTLLSEAYKLV